MAVSQRDEERLREAIPPIIRKLPSPQALAEGVEDGVENAASGGVAGKGRRHEGVGQEDAVEDPGGGGAEAGDDGEGDAAAQARTDDRPGEEEGGDDEDDEVLREAGQERTDADGARKGRRRGEGEGGVEDGKGPHHHRDDGGQEEDRQEADGGGQPGGRGREEEKARPQNHRRQPAEANLPFPANRSLRHLSLPSPGVKARWRPRPSSTAAAFEP